MGLCVRCASRSSRAIQPAARVAKVGRDDFCRLTFSDAGRDTAAANLEWIFRGGDEKKPSTCETKIANCAAGLRYVGVAELCK